MLQTYAATSGIPWLLLLSAWTISLLVVAGVYAAWNSIGLRLVLNASGVRAASGSPLEDLPEQLLRTAPLPAAIFEGDALDLAVGLNTTGPARGPATVTGTVGGLDITFSTGIVPRGGWRSMVEIPALRRGPLSAASWEIVSGDFAGFLRVRRRCPDVEVALVMPRFASLRERRDVRELEASLAAPRAGTGTELFGVREYRSGDSLRRIHWRSSARHGELVVREYEPPGLQTLTIVLDPEPPTTEVADQIARIAASEAWDCLREGGRVSLVAPGLEPSDSPRDLWGLLEWLARYPNGPSGPSDNLFARGQEVVLVTSRQIDVPATRAWVVGEAQIDLDIPLERVGTQWPL